MTPTGRWWTWCRCAALQKPVTLATIKADPELAQMALLRRSRLSVVPVTGTEFGHILKLGKTKLPKAEASAAPKTKPSAKSSRGVVMP
jgi:predicted RNA-binding protein with PUA-like domain